MLEEGECLGFVWGRRGAFQFPLDPLGEEYLEQRLIGYVSLVCQQFELIQQGFRQPQRDRLGRRFEIGEDDAFCLRPIDVLARIMLGPKLTLGILIRKFRNLLFHSALYIFLSFRLMSRADMTRMLSFRTVKAINSSRP